MVGSFNRLIEAPECSASLVARARFRFDPVKALERVGNYLKTKLRAIIAAVFFSTRSASLREPQR